MNNTKAKFLVLNDKDYVVGFAQGSKGQVSVIDGLCLGNYKLIQYEAPCGYKPSPKPVYFKLTQLCCTLILEVPVGIKDDGQRECSEIDYLTCANVAIRIN